MKSSLKLLSLLSAAVVSMTMCLTACGEGKVAEHDHVWNAGEVTTEPTCMKDGVKTYTCTVEGCGQTKTENLGKAPHTWDEGEVTVQPTCIKEGEKTFKCTVEGCKGTKTEPIDKVAHTWGEAVVTTPATFTQPGVKTKTCTVEGCGATDTEAIAAQADFGMQFSTDPTTVETSGWTYAYYASFDHGTDPSGWGMGANLTADAENNVWKAEGIQLSKDGFSLDGGKTVAVCFMKKAMPHAEANVEFKFATQNDGVKTYIYSNGKEIYGNNDNEKTIDFTSEDPTDLGGNAHTFVVVIQNTSTEKAEGSLAFTVKPVCLHAWNEGTVKTAATCKAAGEREFTCAVCGDTYTETIPQTDHKIEITIDRPTFTHEGNIHEECAVCGEQQKDTPLPKQVNLEYDFAIADSGEFNGWQVGRVDYNFPTETFEFTPITEHSDEAYKDNANGWKEIKNNWMAANGMMGFAYKFPADAPAKVDFHFVLNAVGDAQFTIRWAVKNSDGDIKTNDGKASFVGDANRAAYDFTEAVDVVANDVLYILVNKEGDTGDQCNFKLVLTEPFAGANFKDEFEVNAQGEFNGWQVGRVDYHFPGGQPKPTDETFDFTKLTESNDKGDGYVYKDGGDTKFEIKNDWMICKNMMGFAYTFGTTYNGKFNFKLERALTDGNFSVRWAVKGSDGVIKTNGGKASWGGSLESDAPFTLNEQISVQSGDTLYVLVNHENGSDQCKYEFTIGDSTQPPVTNTFEEADFQTQFEVNDNAEFNGWQVGKVDYNYGDETFTFFKMTGHDQDNTFYSNSEDYLTYEIKADTMKFVNGMIGLVYTFDGNYNVKFDFSLNYTQSENCKFDVRWAVQKADGTIKTNSGKATWGGSAQSGQPVNISGNSLNVEAGDKLVLIINVDKGDSRPGCTGYDLTFSLNIKDNSAN